MAARRASLKALWMRRPACVSFCPLRKLLIAGSAMAVAIAMMPTTTRSSMSVKPRVAPPPVSRRLLSRMRYLPYFQFVMAEIALPQYFP